MPTSITVSPPDLTLDALDASLQLEATARDQNGATMSVQFNWESSDAVVVTVSADGLVTATGNGTATVTVGTGSVSASASVTVEQAPASIALPQDEILLTALGAEQQLEASVLDANGNAMSAELIWASSEPTVAAVDEDGRITAQANGTASVTVRSGALSGSATVTVMQVLAGIMLAPDNVELTAISQSAHFAVIAADANGSPMTAEVSLSSSDPEVASVTSAGLVTAHANGTATITASVGSVANTATVTVRQALARIVIVPDTVTLTLIGETRQIQVTAMDANGYPIPVDVSLSSSDPEVASVDAKGLLTARTNGTATITATVSDRDRSISVAVAVTVREPLISERPLPVTGDPHVRDSRTGRTPLHAAAMANAPRFIAGLVRAGAEVDARDNYDLTPLHLAAAANAPAAIAALAKAGANPEAASRYNEVPLEYAVDAGSIPPVDAVMALLDAGANPDGHPERPGAPLSSAVFRASAGTGVSRSGHMAILAALLDAGADPNPAGGSTPLHVAASFDNPAVVRALLDAGADPNASGYEGWTPLTDWVIHGENREILPLLMGAGADIEVRDADGVPLLHLAAEFDRSATIAMLLDAGANLESRDNTGRTALHAAAHSTRLSVPRVSAAGAIAALLDAGADPDALDDSGRTALEVSPGDGARVLSALLDAHAERMVADPNAYDEYGYTALHAASRANSPGLISALLRSRAQVDARDYEGNTPLLLAAGSIWRSDGTVFPRLTVHAPSYSPEAIALLAAAGADLSVRDRTGLPALYLAAAARETATIRALLRAGANAGARDREGRTALLFSLYGWALDDDDRGAMVVLAQAEALAVGGYTDFALVVAHALDSPATLPGAGLDVNARDNEGRTLLHWAAGWDPSSASDVLAALMEAGADVNARDLSGRTAVHDAVRGGNAATITALAEAGADLDVDAPGPGIPIHLTHRPAVVTALAAAGADLEARDRAGRTALHRAAEAGDPVRVRAILEAGADVEARDMRGRTPLHLAASRDDPGQRGGATSTPAAVAALLEAGANPDTPDSDGNTALHAALVGGNHGATGVLAALGAKWTSGAEARPTEINARIVAVELFQGPMVWQWPADESHTAGAGSGMGEGIGANHAKTLLQRAIAVAVRIGSEIPDPLPELSVSLSDAAGRAWATGAELVQNPRIVSVASDSQSGLWETEYVYELPPDWVDSGHRAIFSIDPHNRLAETDENDNTATLTMDGHTVPVLNVTFVPILFSGDLPAIDIDTYMAVIDDLLPIGNYRAQVGRLLDLSDRNLGTSNWQMSRDTALSELFERWNAEAGANEYYHGLMASPDQATTIRHFGVFGEAAHIGGHVAVSTAIRGPCQVERVFCGEGVQAHGLGHNFGLVHLPYRCAAGGEADHDFPYEDAGIGPRRGWVASRNEFANPAADHQYYDLMGRCTPRFVSDYNYNKMVDFRLGDSQSPTSGTGRIGPSLEIGPDPAVAASATAPVTLGPEYSALPGAAASTAASGPRVALTGAAEELGSSLAFAGSVDEYGLWSVGQIDASAQPPRSPGTGSEYIFTLQDAYQREIHREPLALLTVNHGETRRAWAVRVPVTEDTPVFLAILDAQGTPLYIEPIVVPPATSIERNP